MYTEYDEIEIDLRAFVRTLLNHRYLIVMSVIVAAAVAFSVTALQPKQYQATAFVLLPTDQQKASADFVQMATSDGIISQLSQADALMVSTSELKAMMSVDKLATGVRLHIEGNDPAQATALVNLWADEFANYTNQLFGLPDLESELGQAEQRLGAAEQALLDSEIAKKTTLLAAQQATAEQQLQLFEHNQTQIENTLLGVNSLHQQLIAGQHIQDELFQMLLASVQTVLVGTQETITFQFSESIDSLSQAEQTTQMMFLKTALEEKSQELQQQITTWKNEIETTQHTYQVALVEQERLVRAKDAASEQVILLSQALNELRVVPENAANNVQVYSYASDAERTGRPLLNVALASMLAGMASVGYVILRSWWLEEAEWVSTPRLQQSEPLGSPQLGAAD